MLKVPVESVTAGLSQGRDALSRALARHAIAVS